MARLVHIAALVCGGAAAVILVIAGIAAAIIPDADPVTPGKLVLFGVAGMVGAVVATVDGARALPQLGLWKVGATFEGLGDLAFLIILGVLGAATGLSFLF